MVIYRLGDIRNLHLNHKLKVDDNFLNHCPKTNYFHKEHVDGKRYISSVTNKMKQSDYSFRYHLSLRDVDEDCFVELTEEQNQHFVKSQDT